MARNTVFQILFVAIFLALFAGSNVSVAQAKRESGTAGPDTPIQEIAVGELQRLLLDDRAVIVDTRDSNAFNGWRLEGIARGGHIRGAVNFSASWLELKRDGDDGLLKTELKEKQIVPGKRIVLCDSNERGPQKMAEFFGARGVTDLCRFDLKRWADDESLPLVRYPNWQMLVPPVVVKQLIDGGRPESFENAVSVKFAEVSWGDESKSYSGGHIPGSFHINTDSVEPPPAWMLASDEQLTEFALAHGFVESDTVILSSEDPMAACRMAVVLRYIGVRDVRVLNGGLASWKAAGLELELERHVPVPSGEFGATVPVRPELVDTYREVLRGLESPDRFTLVDNRSWEEHIGEISGYPYHFKKGRVPGARFGHAGQAGASSLGDYRNIDGTMRSAEGIRSLWESSGIDPRTHLSFMCGSGWRAAEVLTYANVIGISDAAIYSDGWIGWSNNPDNPVETGVPDGFGKSK